MARRHRAAAAPPVREDGDAPAGAGVPLLLAVVLLLAPAVGVPHEEMLQDTLKSMVVAFGTLGAALLFFAQQRQRRAPLRWHGIVWLPLALCAYALGSMAWSHTYLAGVEAIRWFLFALVVWLGLNTVGRGHVTLLAWGIHAGALVASLWTVLQFWADFRFFPQGPNPASTFINRNFFAEYAVSTLPFGVLLLARARLSSHVALLSASLGVVVVAILMTGTRGALIALWAQLFLVLPFILWRYRERWMPWSTATRVLAGAVLAATVLGLGSIPTGNSRIVAEERGTTALQRAVVRTGAIRPDDHSLGIRMVMWRATLTMIQARPLQGVGAGAWESEIPRYQARGAQLETDYYVHNELLQLVAEYGLPGWLVLAALLGYLSWAAWRTWRAATPAEQDEAPVRALVLTSLLALLIVSNIGFPWRLAATGALFALCLGLLAASDARLGLAARWTARPLRWQPAASAGAAFVTVACLALAAHISWLAAESERKIVRATKIALTISAAGDWDSPRWRPARTEMLRLIREGTEINPHYRKITPIVADELARWGDWKNALWIWESVLTSRPYVVAIISNVARAHASLGDTARAMETLARARQLQPDAPAVRSLEVILLARAGEEDRAVALARDALDRDIADWDLVNTAFSLGWQRGDTRLAERAMAVRLERWPDHRVASWLQLGALRANVARDAAGAAAAYQRAIDLVPPQQQAAVRQQIPRGLWPQLRFAGDAQTSESSK